METTHPLTFIEHFTFSHVSGSIHKTSPFQTYISIVLYDIFKKNPFHHGRLKVNEVIQLREDYSGRTEATLNGMLVNSYPYMDWTYADLGSELWLKLKLETVLTMWSFRQMLPGVNVSRLLARTGVDWIVVDCKSASNYLVIVCWLVSRRTWEHGR